MKLNYLNLMIKPASACNLKCKYCFYNKVKPVTESMSMDYDVMEKIIEKSFEITNDFSVINFNFQGGEPLLAGKNYFKEFINKVNQLKERRIVNYTVQTNGILIDYDWVKFFKANNFLVGLSIDGFKENNDIYRIDKNNSGTHQRILESYELLKTNEIDTNILTVLTRNLINYPQHLYEFYKSNEMDYVQLIPCLDFGYLDYESLDLDKLSEFYRKLFKIYINDENPVNIDFFQNIGIILSRKIPYKCGMKGFCETQLIIDSKGQFYPCDFYTEEKYKLGDISTDSLEEIINSNINDIFRSEKMDDSLCKRCRFSIICKGMCKKISTVYMNISNDQCLIYDFLGFIVEGNFRR